MADTEQEKTLSEIVVKELVEQGMDSPMRDSILEAVEESEGTSAGGSSLPLAGALLGLGAAVGFLAGRESAGLEETPLGDVREPEIIEDITEEIEESEEAEAEPEAEIEEPESSSGRLGRLLLVLGALVGIAVLRRRLASGEDEAWEPIEEFEPATDIGEEEADEEEAEDEADEEEAEADEDEAEATEAGEETEE